ncbi:MAG: bactofilin family protein [Pseudolabrys sp.]
MSYFSSPKTDPKGDLKGQPKGAGPRVDTPAVRSAQEAVSTIGPGMVITGNVVSTGAAQIHGRVNGDVHVAQLSICSGAQVEGKIVAQEVVIEGTFKGTIHGNNVRLRASAVVDGEIYNKSLTIEENAQFEGVARRLDRAVETPPNAAAPDGAEVIRLGRAPAQASDLA